MSGRRTTKTKATLPYGRRSDKNTDDGADNGSGND
jgi:hypothetical protein